MTNQLSIPELPFPKAWLPQEAYLVGGTVRDILLQRQRYPFDLDLVVGDHAIALARNIANHCKAGFVALDTQRDIARIVFKEGTVDIAKIEGETLEEDLKRRDFTINAIAQSLHDQTLIDPLKGKQDLEAKLIKMVSPHNLKADPLRLLRAYRQGAQLNFTIDDTTRETIRHLAPFIVEVAAERVQTELSYLFVTVSGGIYLQQAWEDGILSLWFPSLNQEKVQQAQSVDTIAKTLAQHWSQLAVEWQKNVGGESDPFLSLAKLTCLVSTSPEAAEEELTTLKYSRAEIRTVTATLSVLPSLLDQQVETMSLRDQYFFFQKAVTVFPCVILAAVAKGLKLESAEFLIERYLNPNDPVAYPEPIVTGKDLLRSLSLSPSPKVGELLTELQIAYIEGKIHSKAEAIELGREFLT
ncbi:CCA tRNA nucleotidyltransferase [Euhalothece natronophila Z-M001]|uniref:CCA tRNA nucleotidyltransferase n=1 Tax=Euhalothece natronophila Z-M001 TaxID=522448 RepID=A0A5B8NPF5_9CHRO|nr:CCA tRNA nucleotidyltransferase [Euhalothece natronophila]QDZ40421.1 CCA tRNA nucleotidyltransferase [Euhalothece natronophila Z-M001]